MPVNKTKSLISSLLSLGILASFTVFADERINYSVIDNSSKSAMCVEILNKDINSVELISIKNDIQKNASNTKKIKNVEFLRAFQLGNYVNVDLVYSTDDRKIKWREDYLMESGLPTRQQDAKFHQLYELTYLKLKENNYKKCSFNLSDKSLHVVRWSTPVGGVSEQRISKDDTGIVWRLPLEKIDIVIEKKGAAWKFSNEKSAFAKAFSSQILNGEKIDNDKGLEKPVYFRTVLNDSGRLTSVQLESKERVRDYISRWNYIRIIGQVSNGKKGFVYFVTKEGAASQELPNVIQFEINSRDYIFYHAVEADYDSAIFSNIAILDSLKNQ